MSITVRLGGLSVQCDACGHGGFIGTHNMATALAHFGLTDAGEGKHACIEQCLEVA